MASFTALRSHVDEQKEAGRDVICALMMDEMHIYKQSLVVTKCTVMWT